MSKGAHNFFSLNINFLGVNWLPKQIIIGLFKAIKTIGQGFGYKLNKTIGLV